MDLNPHKQGHLLPGTHIPIRPPEAISEDRPDVVFILPWNLKDEIVEQLGRRTQEVSQAATEHASASEEVTAAAEEQSASTEEMASAAGDLLQGATRLTSLMQQFKT